jgi:hypothetical protein
MSFSFAQVEPFGNARRSRTVGSGTPRQPPGRRRDVKNSLREGIAGFHVAGGESLLKPVHALLRGAVREGIGIHVPG